MLMQKCTWNIHMTTNFLDLWKYFPSNAIAKK
jgi:hypothetical protein